MMAICISIISVNRVCIFKNAETPNALFAYLDRAICNIMLSLTKKPNRKQTRVKLLNPK